MWEDENSLKKNCVVKPKLKTGAKVAWLFYASEFLETALGSRLRNWMDSGAILGQARVGLDVPVCTVLLSLP